MTSSLVQPLYQHSLYQMQLYARELSLILLLIVEKAAQ